MTACALHLCHSSYLLIANNMSSGGCSVPDSILVECRLDSFLKFCLLRSAPLSVEITVSEAVLDLYSFRKKQKL